MRIIAGIARSRRIDAPKGQGTRPTLDGVREALFNILQGRCEGARALDLFCGSGALGLEAISRGAALAALNDVSREAAAVARRNAESLGFAERVRVTCADWQAALSALSRAGERFDLVFLDPPYAMPATPVLEALAALSLLAEDALVIVEHDAARAPAQTALVLRDTRRYRDTCLSFFALREENG